VLWLMSTSQSMARRDALVISVACYEFGIWYFHDCLWEIRRDSILFKLEIWQNF
jgi:hypothetical protein